MPEYWKDMCDFHLFNIPGFPWRSNLQLIQKVLDMFRKISVIIVFAITMSDIASGFADDAAQSGGLNNQPQHPESTRVVECQWITETPTLINVNTGIIKFSVNKSDFKLFENVFFDYDENGKFSQEELVVEKGNFLLKKDGIDYSCKFDAASVELTSANHLKCNIRARGWLTNASGEKCCGYQIDIQAYYAKQYIKMLHSLDNFNYSAASKNGGRNDVDRVAKIQFSINMETDNKICSFGTEDGLQSAMLNKWVRLIQEHAHYYKLTNEQGSFGSGIRASGWADISDDKKGIAILLNNFNKDNPEGFLIHKDEVITYLWPPHAGLLNLSDLAAKYDHPGDRSAASEIIFYFHRGNVESAILSQLMTAFIKADEDVYLGARMRSR